MCTAISKTLGKVLDPLRITQRIHKVVDEKVRDPLYRKLGIQNMQLRDPFAETQGAKKTYTTEEELLEGKAAKAESAATAKARGTTSTNGLVIGQRYGA